MINALSGYLGQLSNVWPLLEFILFLAICEISSCPYETSTPAFLQHILPWSVTSLNQSIVIIIMVLHISFYLYRVSKNVDLFFKLQFFLYKVQKSFDFLCGYCKVIFFSFDDVSPPDGNSRGSDLMMTT